LILYQQKQQKLANIVVFVDRESISLFSLSAPSSQTTYGRCIASGPEKPMQRPYVVWLLGAEREKREIDSLSTKTTETS
jgi:hypothetical protein